MKSFLSWMLFVNIENHKKFIAHNACGFVSGVEIEKLMFKYRTNAK